MTRLGPPLAAALAIAAALAGSGAQGQSILDQSEWLPKGSELGTASLTRPRQVLRTERTGGSPSFLAQLGELVFRAPDMLGGNARKAGISCDTCHSGGAKNTRFFIPGLSSKHGTVDVTHRLWNQAADDGLDNPLSIPSLRGVGTRGVFGFRGEFTSLREFTRKVIMQEFAGDEPPPILLDALIVYEDELAPLPNLLLDQAGNLTAAAPEDARTGEPLFRKLCSSCHNPEQGFADGRRHDVGSGGPVRTPSLLGVDFNAPYFHDGRYATLAEAVGHFDKTLGFAPGSREHEQLVAYVQAVGRGEAPTVEVTLSSDLDRLGRFVALLRRPLLDENADLAEAIARLVRNETGRIAGRFANSNAAQTVLRGWARSVADIGHDAETRKFPEARGLLDDLQRRLLTEAGPLAVAEAASLYNAESLKAALAKQPEN
ncbi:MAG TPA: cytochrome c peroxidase [Candidatus Cybelea sp.]|nr:cytochrome c peroxidase [Candidatus Cybelea sp.]